MKQLLFLLGLIGVLFAPSLGLAKENKTDHTQCEEMDTDAAVPLFSRGGWIPTACILLCDGYAAADTGAGCVEWDFQDSPGMPDIIVLEYEEEDSGDCGATPDFAITTGPMSNGTLTNQTNASYAGDPAYEIDATAVVLNATTNRVIILTKDAPLDRYLFTNVTDEASCTDVDIRMFFFNRKTSMF